MGSDDEEGGVVVVEVVEDEGVGLFVRNKGKLPGNSKRRSLPVFRNPLSYTYYNRDESMEKKGERDDQ